MMALGTLKATEASNVMIYVGGSRTSFHCDNEIGQRGETCGCNVFHKPDPSTPKRYAWQRLRLYLYRGEA